MSKHTDVIKDLLAKGWSVNPSGEVVQPDGTIRPTRIKKGSVRNSSPGKTLRTEYKVFGLQYNGRATEVKVHKLAAGQKFGEEGLTISVRHLDDNSLNNSPSNIGLGTVHENWMDMPDTKRGHNASKAREARRLISDDDVISIRTSSLSAEELAAQHSVSVAHIKDIRKKRRYKNIG